MSQIHRRNFLTTIAAAAFALDPERLLWKPGARLISIPKPKPHVLGYLLAFHPIHSVVSIAFEHGFGLEVGDIIRVDCVQNDSQMLRVRSVVNGRVYAEGVYRYQ